MPKIVGYTNRLSVRPGESIDFKVSCEEGAAEYDAEILRLICGDDSPHGAGFKAHSVAGSINGRYPGRKQRVNAGSFGYVAQGVPIENHAQFVVGLSAYPTWREEKSEQTLIAARAVDRPGQPGWAMTLDAEGRLRFEISDGRVTSSATLSRPVPARNWSRLLATIDWSAGEIRLEQVGKIAETRATAKLSVDRSALAAAPLTIAAELVEIGGERLFTRNHFDGKIASPGLWWRDGGDRSAPEGTYAVWDFSIGIDTQKIRVRFGNGHDGILVNLPTRGVRGPIWRGKHQRWSDSADDYDAIHFHCDDLHDMQWETDFSWTIPADLPSGIYAARITCAGNGEDFVPFFVLPAKDAKKAPVAFLASTFTFLAYANSHHGYEDPLSEVCYGALLELGPTEMFLKERRDFGISLYDRHRDGSGGVYSSWHRPILNMRPKRALWNFNADLHVIDWLTAAGQTFDVITDDVLHAEGESLLRDYRCIITGSHPEYHSTQMLDAFEDYLQKRGRLMYLGGNGFYWKIATHPDLPGVIEVRRGEAGTRCYELPPGERFHSFTGEPGGLWRSLGRAPQALVGVGFVAEGFDANSYFIRTEQSFDPRAAFIFEGIGADEKIGDFGVLGGAAGYELDASDPALGTPAHALVLARSVEHSNTYLLTPEELLAGFPGQDAIENPKVRAELVYFETGNDGAVFSTGSITWAASLCHNGYDNNVARITGNVLRRFLDPRPL